MDASILQQLEALRQENRRLREQLDQRDRFIEQLQQTIRDLKQRLDESERAAKRQAAPFSKGPPKAKPKRPGRKKGEKHGQHAHRQPPPPEQVTETLDAPLPNKCPDANCGGAASMPKKGDRHVFRATRCLYWTNHSVSTIS